MLDRSAVLDPEAEARDRRFRVERRSHPICITGSIAGHVPANRARNRVVFDHVPFRWRFARRGLGAARPENQSFLTYESRALARSSLDQSRITASTHGGKVPISVRDRDIGAIDPSLSGPLSGVPRRTAMAGCGQHRNSDSPGVNSMSSQAGRVSPARIVPHLRKG